VRATDQAGRRTPTPASTWRTVRRLALAVVVLAAGGATAALVWTSPTLTSQVAESVSRRPAQFTELYFTAPARIPKRLSTSGPNTFGFTIANHEGGTVAYPYLVTVQSPEGTSIISRDTVTVASGGVVQEIVQFMPRHPATIYVFSVHISGRSEVIHFVGTS
jgi:hypothetical protein